MSGKWSPHYWPFVRGLHPCIYLTKGESGGALIFLLSAEINRDICILKRRDVPSTSLQSACVTLWRQLRTRFVPRDSSYQCTNMCCDYIVFFVFIPHMRLSVRKHVNRYTPKVSLIPMSTDLMRLFYTRWGQSYMDNISWNLEKFHKILCPWSCTNSLWNPIC